MTRGYYWSEESMIYVRGRPGFVGTIPDNDINDTDFGGGSGLGVKTELGITTGPIIMKWKSYHHNIHVDDFGPNVPAEVLGMLTEAELTMTLVHFDAQVLAQCVKESMGYSESAFGVSEGTLPGAGWPLGAGMAMGVLDSDDNPSFVNSYIRLSFATSLTWGGDPLGIRNRRPWRFFSCYLAEDPVEFPLGSETSLVKLKWRAIPYVVPGTTGDVSSRNARLFDHNDDDNADFS